MLRSIYWEGRYSRGEHVPVLKSEKQDLFCSCKYSCISSNKMQSFFLFFFFFALINTSVAHLWIEPSRYVYALFSKSQIQSSSSSTDVSFTTFVGAAPTLRVGNLTWGVFSSENYNLWLQLECIVSSLWSSCSPKTNKQKRTGRRLQGPSCSVGW